MLFIFIIFSPLVGSICSSLFGSFLSRQGSVFITCFFIGISFFCSICLFLKLIITNTYYTVSLVTWVNSGLFYCDWGFLFDSLTIIMLLVVTSISLLVHLYSSEYMLYDPHLSRFMSYISLFTFFMLMLVTADNLLQMFVGWEGVGFCSYLLINFWYTRLQANKAAIKAMLINRISDFALILGIFILFIHCKSIEYSSIFAIIVDIQTYYFDFLSFPVNNITLIGILFFIGAMGKSAQLFLHTWLPDAMEGPTPVSALIHAATMVTAGVFLLTRCSPLFELSSIVLKMIILIGALTAFFASTVGLVQNDLKKVIAYSTCSQLGYMIFACGLSNYNIGVFHLYNHAFFKALLFLSAGSVIHALGDEQDMRKMGGLRRLLPFTYSMFVIGSLSLMGFPFLTGFYSKDPILEVAYGSFSNIGHFAYWLGTLAAFCTAFYSTRLLYLTFLLKTNVYKSLILHVHDAPIRMALPLLLLSFFSIFIGYLSRDLFIGLGTDFWCNSIYIMPSHLSLIDSEFLSTNVKMTPIYFSFLGMISAFFLYQLCFKSIYKFKISNIGLIFYNFLNRKWFFDKIYHEIITQNILHFSYFKSYKLIDKGLIELLGPTGIINNSFKLSRWLSKLHTSYIYNMSTSVIISCIFFLIYLILILN